jgi:reductive dehalogenase
MATIPGNVFGEEMRQRLKARGIDAGIPLPPPPYGELEPEDRIGYSLNTAARRLCREYHPQPLPLTPPEGRIEVNDRGQMSRLIKKVALFFGAEMVRITRVDPRWIYKDIEIPHPFAIVLVVTHVRSFNVTAPSHYSGAAVSDTYSRLKFTSVQLTDFIRLLGYDAMYRETLGMHQPEILMVPTAIDAGVGEFARNGHVLSPEFGINMRVKAVTTDLPLEVDKPISFGAHEFCLACEQCAQYCPAKAIPFGPPTQELADPVYNNPGYRKWYVNAERCLTFWTVNRKKWSTCGGRCIVACPWNKPDKPWHNWIRRIAIHAPSGVKKFLSRADETFYRRGKKSRFF